MISEKSFAPKRLILLITVFVFSFITVKAQDGKTLFQNNCASCHNVFNRTTGPALGGFQERENGKWADIKELTKWIHNPVNYMASDPYTTGLKAEYVAMMTGSPHLNEEQIVAIADHINTTFAKGQGGGGSTSTDGTTDPDTSNRGGLIFGIISLIMAIIALILMQVNSNLKKLSDDAEGILRPDPVPFYKNKVYITLFAIVLFIVGGYYTASALIDFGRQKNYQPEQPIYYSHKVHAGINQINCLYCHGAAMESKHAAIPSVNVCMNCHKTITSYTKGPELIKEDGTVVNGTKEIEKLFSYAGFDPKNAGAWDPSKAKPIPWTKIHNLPDHVYFNHSQHIKAGKVQCQTCHGEITDMDEVYQFSELSMGWCVNCHRDTKVDFYKIDTAGRETGNKFYSVYEKFLSPDTVWTDATRTKIKEIHKSKLDSVTVNNIGGLECQKCHY